MVPYRYVDDRKQMVKKFQTKYNPFRSMEHFLSTEHLTWKCLVKNVGRFV